MPSTNDLSRKRQRLIQRAKNKCRYCRRRVESKDMTLDHKVPRSKGGDNSWRNLAPCCIDCNQLKADMSVEEFKQFLAAREAATRGRGR